MIVRTLLTAILAIYVQHSLAFHIGHSKLSPHFTTERLSKLSTTNSRVPRTPSRLHAIKGPVRYSSNHWLECLLTLPTSRVLKRIHQQLTLFTAWGALLTWIHMTGRANLAIPTLVHSILGSALSLLLVFKTNSGYDRFWEGRKLWGSVIWASRDLARSVYMYTDPKYHPRVAKLILVFCICLKQHLQGERVSSELEPYLHDHEEVTRIQKLKNRPLMLTRMLHELIYEAINEKYPDPIRSVGHERSTEESLHTLNVAAASCERIVKQPVPLAYVRNASRFLSFYLLTLPCALVSSLGWFTIPGSLFVNWSFITILQIGAFMEDPFEKELNLIHIPQFISVVQTDLSELLGEQVCSPAMWDMDQAMQEESRRMSRLFGDDTFFAYY